MISVSLFDRVSQLSHFGWGALVIMASIALGLPPRFLWIVFVVWLILTAWKEFWYDQRYETPIVRGSNARDFIFYQGGAVVAIVLLYVFHLVGGTCIPQ